MKNLLKILFIICLVIWVLVFFEVSMLIGHAFPPLSFWGIVLQLFIFIRKKPSCGGLISLRDSVFSVFLLLQTELICYS